MSYLSHAHDPRRRATAIAVTVAVHAALGLGVVTGLTVAFYPPPAVAPEPILEFPTEAPKPKPTPTTPPEQSSYIPPEPKAPLDLTEDAGPVRKPVESDETAFSLYPDNSEAILPPAPPSTPRFTPTRAVPTNNSGNWITTNDYPRRELVGGREGSVGYRLVIGTSGRVASCELVRPSGVTGLDKATCRLITDRARFDPATDETGAKVLGTFTGTVKWEIPQ